MRFIKFCAYFWSWNIYCLSKYLARRIFGKPTAESRTKNTRRSGKLATFYKARKFWEFANQQLFLRFNYQLLWIGASKSPTPCVNWATHGRFISTDCSWIQFCCWTVDDGIIRKLDSVSFRPGVAKYFSVLFRLLRPQRSREKPTNYLSGHVWHRHWTPCRKLTHSYANL